MSRKKETIERMNGRVKELIKNFDDFVKYFDKASIFTGPSLYFHKKTIEILYKNGLSKALEMDQFLEYLYATLTSWGLHRMGKTKTKLLDFKDFKKSITSEKEALLKLENKKITELSIDTSITNQLQELIENLKISEAKTKIVFNSKAIHHLLPDLMPPIDRQYTLLFFYNSTSPSHIDNCFSEIYPKFISIAIEKNDTILGKVKDWKDSHTSFHTSFHTSETKVIDNAIVGYVLKENLKGQKKRK